MEKVHNQGARILGSWFTYCVKRTTMYLGWLQVIAKFNLLKISLSSKYAKIQKHHSSLSLEKVRLFNGLMLKKL